MVLDFPRPYSDAMPASEELMVGLVTHRGSRFRTQGMATLESVSSAAKSAGIDVRVIVGGGAARFEVG